MAMERFTVTMSERDIDNFEKERGKLGMNKSAFIRFLIAEHEKKIPSFLKNKEIIKESSELNTLLRSLILKESLTDVEKLEIFEKIDGLNCNIKKLCDTMARSG